MCFATSGTFRSSASCCGPAGSLRVCRAPESPDAGNAASTRGRARARPATGAAAPAGLLRGSRRHADRGHGYLSDPACVQLSAGCGGWAARTSGGADPDDCGLERVRHRAGQRVYAGRDVRGDGAAARGAARRGRGSWTRSTTARTLPTAGASAASRVPHRSSGPPTTSRRCS